MKTFVLSISLILFGVVAANAQLAPNAQWIIDNVSESKVYVYRNFSLLGCQFNYKIKLNGVKLGKLSNARYIEHNVMEGKNEVEVYVPILFGLFSKKIVHTFYATGNRAHYVMLNMTAKNFSSFVINVDEQVGKEELKRIYPDRCNNKNQLVQNNDEKK